MPEYNIKGSKALIRHGQRKWSRGPNFRRHDVPGSAMSFKYLRLRNKLAEITFNVTQKTLPCFHSHGQWSSMDILLLSTLILIKPDRQKLLAYYIMRSAFWACNKGLTHSPIYCSWLWTRHFRPAWSGQEPEPGNNIAPWTSLRVEPSAVKWPWTWALGITLRCPRPVFNGHR